METTSFYNGDDPRELPLYSIYEAAHHLKIPPSTLRSWVEGRTYEVKGGEAYFEPLISLADPENSLLSFQNLVEVYVLSALRIKHDVKMSAIRTAIQYAEEQLDIDRLLLKDELTTSAGDLFWDVFGDLVNLSEAGQLTFREVLEEYLERVERDPSEMPTRLHPIIPHRTSKSISIDPRISFGRPTVRGITTATLAERAESGETIEVLAEDYGLGQNEVKDAILYEMAA